MFKASISCRLFLVSNAWQELHNFSQKVGKCPKVPLSDVKLYKKVTGTKPQWLCQKHLWLVVRQEVWNSMTFKVSTNPSHSMIPWFYDSIILWVIAYLGSCLQWWLWFTDCGLILSVSETFCNPCSSAFSTDSQDFTLAQCIIEDTTKR